MSKCKPCGPTAKSIVQSMRNRKVGWAKAIGELIDNSVGNGAKTVRVQFRPHYVECVDDGVGCTPEKFAALVSLGMHVEDETVRNAVSRFGVGAKDAFIWCGGPTQVCSVRDGLHQYIEVDWDAFEVEWDYEDIVTGEPAQRKCVQCGLNGSGVAVSIPHHSRQMNEKHFADTRKQLAELFWAAVETGVSISVEYKPSPKRQKVIGGVLPGKPMPELLAEHSVEADLQLADGRTVRVRGGVLAPAVRMSSPGFEYIYGHRVVITAGGLGAGAMDFERCYFRVFLLGDKEDWQVTTNKVGLHDADEAALGQAVYDFCKPLLDHSQSEAFANLADQELLNDVSEMLTIANRKRSKRNANGGQHGTVKPTGSGHEHTTAAQCHDDPGSKYKPRDVSAGRIRIVRSQFETDSEHLAGLAKVSDRRVRINVLHPFIKRCLEQRDKIGLFVTAMAIWSDAWTRQDDNGQMRNIPRVPFTEKLSAMLKTDENTTA